MDYGDDFSNGISSLNEIKNEKSIETKIEKLLELLPHLESFLKDEPNEEVNIYTHIDLKKIKVFNWATFSNFEIEFKTDIKKVFIIGPSDSGKTNLIRSVQHLFGNKRSFKHTIDTEFNINPTSEISIFITAISNGHVMNFIKKQIGVIFKNFVLSEWLKNEREKIHNSFEFLKKIESFEINEKNLHSLYLLGKMLLPNNPESDYSKIINNVEILYNEIETEFNQLWNKVNKEEYEVQLKLQIYHDQSGKEKLIGNVFFDEEYIPIGNFFKEKLSLFQGNLLNFSGSVYGNVEIEVKIEDVFKEGSMSQLLGLIEPEIAILPRDEGLLETTMEVKDCSIKNFLGGLQIHTSVGMPYTLLRVLREINETDLKLINQLSKTTLQVEFHKQNSDVVFTKNGKTFSLKDSSGSVLHSLILFYTLTRKKSIYILDEPASMWHPSIHFRFNEIIDDLLISSKENIKIIIITHIPTLLNINSTFHVQSDLFRFCISAGSTSCHRADIKSLIRNKDSLEALGMVAFTHSLFYEYNILAEGKLDINYLNALKEMVTPDSKFFEVLKFSNMIPLNGCTNFGLDQFFKTFQLPFTKLKDLDVITFKEKYFPQCYSNYNNGEEMKSVQNQEDLEKLKEFITNYQGDEKKELEKKKIVAEYYLKKLNNQDNMEQLQLELMKEMKYKKFPYKKIIDDLLPKTFEDFKQFSFTVRGLIRTKINEWIWREGPIELAFKTPIHSDNKTAVSAVKVYLEKKKEYPDVNNFLNYIHSKFYMWKSFGENRTNYEGYSIIRFKVVSDCDPSSLVQFEKQPEKKLYNFHSLTHKKEKGYAWYLYFPVKTGEYIKYLIFVNNKPVSHSEVSKNIIESSKESFISQKIKIGFFPNECLTALA
ncbi:hypothetical protein ACTFIY_006635 [Dictyostelium cf. discoideum]